MAIDTITIKDSAGTDRKVLVDNDGSANLAQIVKLGVSADDAAPTQVSTAAPLPVREGGATATLTTITSSATSARCGDGTKDADRRFWSFFNAADKTAYLKFGTTASTTSYTVQVPAGGYYEMPPNVYYGRVDVIWASGPTGNGYLTEVTA